MLRLMTRGRGAFLLLGTACLLALLAVLWFRRSAPEPSIEPRALPKATPPQARPAPSGAPATQADRDEFTQTLSGFRKATRPITVAEARKLRDSLLAFPSLLADLVAVLRDPAAPLAVRQGIAVV